MKKIIGGESVHRTGKRDVLEECVDVNQSKTLTLASARFSLDGPGKTLSRISHNRMGLLREWVCGIQ